MISVVLMILQICLQEMKVEGRKADCIMAAYLASELALRLVKPGEEVCGQYRSTVYCL